MRYARLTNYAPIRPCPPLTSLEVESVKIVAKKSLREFAEIAERKAYKFYLNGELFYSLGSGYVDDM